MNGNYYLVSKRHGRNTTKRALLMQAMTASRFSRAFQIENMTFLSFHCA